MFQAITSFFEMIASIIRGIVHFITYIPKFFEIASSGSQTMLEMFNYLPGWLFAIGSVTIAGAVIWIILEII